MTLSKVESYSLGFDVVDKEAFLHYWLQGDDTEHSLAVSATDLSTLADMFRYEGSMVYDSERQRFVTAKERVGHGDNEPHPKYP